MRIMLVEDDALVAQATEAFLRLHGHEVVGPFSKAADVFRSLQGGRPDLVLMDIGLDGRCSGLDCARVLFKRYRIPVIFITADPDRARGGEGSALGYMTKPVSPAALIRALRAVDDVAHGRTPQPPPSGFTVFHQARQARPPLQ